MRKAAFLRRALVGHIVSSGITNSFVFLFERKRSLRGSHASFILRSRPLSMGPEFFRSFVFLWSRGGFAFSFVASSSVLVSFTRLPRFCFSLCFVFLDPARKERRTKHSRRK